MEQKTLSNWLKCILVGLGICGVLIYLVAIPAYGLNLRKLYPEFSGRFWPWLIFILGTGIPCCAVLVLSWKITANIGRDRSFSEENAKFLKWISVLTAADAGYFLAGNILLFFLSMSHPAVVLVSFLIVFACVALSIASAVLSHLVKKAAQLQEQSDWTI